MSNVRPILFNTDMVRAIMDGRKTVTRRLIKPKPTYRPNSGFGWNGHVYGTDFPPTVKGAASNLRCAAPYQPGDILYVRETWYKYNYRYMYKADYSYTEKFYQDGKGITMKWKPSIHMPKEAARIWLKVTDVRVERLQDMSYMDFMHEGIVVEVGAMECWNTRKTVERIVERLENQEFKNRHEDHMDVWNVGIEQAIEIVRKGGME